MIKESGILNINTKNLIHNYNFFKKLKKNLIVAPTIKANAYAANAAIVIGIIVDGIVTARELKNDLLKLSVINISV